MTTDSTSPDATRLHAGIRIRGKDLEVPSIEVDGRTLIVTGRWLKTAAVRDEAFVQGPIVPDPLRAIHALKNWNQHPDIFAFPQKVGEPASQLGFRTEWDDFALLRLTTYDDWLKNQVKRDVKENLRRARREGIVVRSCVYDDDFVRAISELYNETPIRQGKPFWHYGKSVESIREIHGTYLDRAEYIGAYLGDELIGFLKMVYVDNFAKTMHVISKERHFHKRPTNALIAKAVEICTEKRLSHLIYGEYTFPGKGTNSLTEFKRHHGFEGTRYPRHFIPLTPKGRLALTLKLHKGLRPFVPESVTQVLLKARSAYYRRRYARWMRSSRIWTGSAR